MSPSPRPSRPLPARVYWLRRALVLTLSFGLVFGIAQLLDGGAEPAGETARVVGAATGELSRAATPRATDDARPVRDRKSVGSDREHKRDKPTRTKTKAPLPEPSGPCAPSDIVATPKVKGTAYAGKNVTFRIRLTTQRTPACTWRVAPSALVVKLVSGSDRIWSSQDCARAIPKLDVVVRQEKAAKVDVVWRGQRSDSACSRTTAWAQPGWYHVQAAAFGAEPSDVQFELRSPVPETITPEPKPEKQRHDEQKAD